MSFVLFGVLYASRCNNFHGNVAARMNSINANKDTFKMYTDITFKKSNVEDLKDKLQDACEHPEKVNALKAQASDFICDKYNWDDVVNLICYIHYINSWDNS